MTPTVLTIINIAMGVVMALALFILNSFSGRLKEVEKWKVNKGELANFKEVIGSRFDGLERRIDDGLQYKEHDITRIDNRLSDLQGSVEDVKKCLNLIAQGKDC